MIAVRSLIEEACFGCWYDATEHEPQCIAKRAALQRIVDAGRLLNDVASKAVFEDGHEERLLIENWPLMDALAQFREAVEATEKQSAEPR